MSGSSGNKATERARSCSKTSKSAGVRAWAAGAAVSEPSGAADRSSGSVGVADTGALAASRSLASPAAVLTAGSMRGWTTGGESATS